MTNVPNGVITNHAPVTNLQTAFSFSNDS
jgi:hypothetical protein